MLAGTIVFARDAGLSRDHCSTGYVNALLDDGVFVKVHLLVIGVHGGLMWSADGCVLGVLVGLWGIASGYSWELPFASGHIILFSSSF